MLGRLLIACVVYGTHYYNTDCMHYFTIVCLLVLFVLVSECVTIQRDTGMGAGGTRDQLGKFLREWE